MADNKKPPTTDIPARKIGLMLIISEPDEANPRAVKRPASKSSPDRVVEIPSSSGADLGESS